MPIPATDFSRHKLQFPHHKRPTLYYILFNERSTIEKSKEIVSNIRLTTCRSDGYIGGKAEFFWQFLFESLRSKDMLGKFHLILNSGLPGTENRFRAL